MAKKDFVQFRLNFVHAYLFCRNRHRLANGVETTGQADAFNIGRCLDARPPPYAAAATE
jgi:hypothetical protein